MMLLFQVFLSVVIVLIGWPNEKYFTKFTYSDFSWKGKFPKPKSDWK